MLRFKEKACMRKVRVCALAVRVFVLCVYVCAAYVVCAFACACARECVRAYMHVCIHVYVRTCVRVCVYNRLAEPVRPEIMQVDCHVCFTLSCGMP